MRRDARCCAVRDLVTGRGRPSSDSCGLSTMNGMFGKIGTVKEEKNDSLPCARFGNSHSRDLAVMHSSRLTHPVVTQLMLRINPILLRIMMVTHHPLSPFRFEPLPLLSPSALGDLDHANPAAPMLPPHPLPRNADYSSPYAPATPSTDLIS